MKKILSLFIALTIVILSHAEIKRIVLTPDSFDYDVNVAATTKQMLEFRQDGFTVTGYCGIRGTVSPGRFVFAGKALTTNGAFIAVTGNENNYKIINIEVEIGVKSLSSMMGMYSVRVTDSEPSWVASDQLNASEWNEVGTGSTSAVESRSYEILPGELYAGVFSNGAFSGEYNSIVITYDSGAGKPTVPGEKVEPTLFFSQKYLTYALDATNADITSYLYNPENLPLSWSVSPDDGGITVSDGKLSFSTIGDYVVTASYAGSEDYLAKEVSVNVTVEEGLPAIVGEVLPEKTDPADYAQLNLFSALSEVSVTYPALGDNGIESIDRRDDNFITVSKDGVVIQKIPTSDRSKIYIDRNDYNKLHVELNPITEVGKYKIKFPANLVEIDLEQRGVVSMGVSDASPSDNVRSTDYVKSHTAPYTLNIIVLSSDVNTGVDSIDGDEDSVDWYDLQGTRISRPSKGIYIRQSSGKYSKVIIR